MEKDTTKLWKLTKRLNEEAADSHWVTEWAPDTKESRKLFRTHVPRGEHSERTRRVKNEIKKQLLENIPADGCITDAIQKDELEAEIRTFKTKKAPGPDGVTHDMILHLGLSSKKAILALFNKSRKSGIVPAL